MSGQAFPEWFNGGEKFYPECGSHHPMGWGPRPRQEESEQMASNFPDIRDTVTSFLVFLLQLVREGDTGGRQRGARALLSSC